MPPQHTARAQPFSPELWNQMQTGNGSKQSMVKREIVNSSVVVLFKFISAQEMLRPHA